MIINIRKADDFFIKKLQDKQMPSLEREIHILFYKGGAGNGDRTRLTSLGSWCPTDRRILHLGQPLPHECSALPTQ